MINNKSYLSIILLIAVLTSAIRASACTSVIVSGRITKDGRPMLFKNRDTSNQNNVAVLVKGSIYRLRIGLGRSQ